MEDLDNVKVVVSEMEDEPPQTKPIINKTKKAPKQTTKRKRRKKYSIIVNPSQEPPVGSVAKTKRGKTSRSTKSIVVSDNEEEIADIEDIDEPRPRPVIDIDDTTESKKGKKKIRAPVTEKKPWSHVHEKNYKWLYGSLKNNPRFPNLDYKTYIDKYKKPLLTFIEQNDKWKDTSKENLLFMIARYLYNRQVDNKTYDYYVDHYSEAGYALKLLQDEKAGENKMSDKELKSMKPRQHFVNLLSSINDDELFAEDKQNTKYLDHLRYLMLSTLIYQPPLRTDFYTTAEFTTKKPKRAKIITLENDKKSRKEKQLEQLPNYIWISKRGKGTVTFIINHDKVSNTKTYKNNKELSEIVVEEEALKQLMIRSYKRYPRKYFMQTNLNRNIPTASTTLLQWIKKISQEPEITISIFRKIYINWFYDTHKTFSDRFKLAHKMRHSMMTAQKDYRKVDETVEEAKGEKEYDIVINELQQEILTLKSTIKDLEEKLKSYQNKKAEPVSLLHYRKARRDIIGYCNKHGKTPKKETIKRYDLKFVDGKWQ